MTDGLEVLVQLVMAAMTTEPWSSVISWPSISTRTLSSEPASALSKTVPSAVWKERSISARGMRSWGSMGPARLASTADMSSSTVSLY